MNAPTELPAGGHTVIRSRGDDPLPALLESYSRVGARISRDVVIGGNANCADLIAQPGDFWFHTDGVFWLLPPRWVVIQVLETEGGGELEMANAAPLLSELPEGLCFFGSADAGRTAPVVERTAGGLVLRYRTDYMHPLAGGVELEPLHALIRARLPALSSHLGALSVGDCLILDNWSQLHRRREFIGNRRIRRVWLDGEP